MATWLLSGKHFSQYQDTSEQDRQGPNTHWSFILVGEKKLRNVSVNKIILKAHFPLLLSWPMLRSMVTSVFLAEVFCLPVVTVGGYEGSLLLITFILRIYQMSTILIIGNAKIKSLPLNSLRLCAVLPNLSHVMTYTENESGNCESLFS